MKAMHSPIIPLTSQELKRNSVGVRALRVQSWYNVDPANQHVEAIAEAIRMARRLSTQASFSIEKNERPFRVGGDDSGDAFRTP